MLTFSLPLSFQPPLPQVQTDDLDRVNATSADNIEMEVTSSVNWQIVDVELAARMASESMKSGRHNDSSSGARNADISKLRKDVLKQAIAALASYIGGVNYSESFHISAAAQASKDASNLAQQQSLPTAQATVLPPSAGGGAGGGALPEASTFTDNPLYNKGKMASAVDYANQVTSRYGVNVISVNIISASPCDAALTRSLASGAVASAEALQAETSARGQARAMAVEAEAQAERSRLIAQGEADARVIQAEAQRQSKDLVTQAEARATRERGAATADALRSVTEALSANGAKDAMVQQLAQQYIAEYSQLAKTANLMIVPDQPNNVAGVVATAMGLSNQIGKAAESSNPFSKA